MQTFVYKARGADGSSQSGEILAASEAEALGQLRRRRLSGVSVRPKPRSLELSFRKGASTKDLVVFTRQFATMISAGLPLVQSLDTLSAQQSKPKVADKIRAVLREVQSGATLADAMRRQRDFFGDIYVSMVAAGEVGGVLDTILARLADYLEDTARLKRKVRSAMVYPVTIFAFAIVAIAVLLIFVIPTFAQFFIGAGVPLPLPTRIVIATSDFMLAWWWSVAGRWDPKSPRHSSTPPAGPTRSSSSCLTPAARTRGRAAAILSNAPGRPRMRSWLSGAPSRLIASKERWGAIWARRASSSSKALVVTVVCRSRARAAASRRGSGL